MTLIANHSGVVADILHHCFDCLPDFDGIVQGDFIGFGGDDTYCPNTITYIFDEVIDSGYYHRTSYFVCN